MSDKITDEELKGIKIKLYESEMTDEGVNAMKIVTVAAISAMLVAAVTTCYALIKLIDWVMP
jgi:hypothetical protein